MPARDVVRAAVRHALESDGWRITHAPLLIPFGRRNVYADLGAEAPLAAEKGNRKIAVEIKSFLGASEVADLEQALGQYTLYGSLLAKAQPDRVLYLAIKEEAYNGLFGEADGRDLIEGLRLRIIVVDIEQEVIVRWIEPPVIATS